MRPVEEKAQSVTWSNPNKDSFDDKTSFKKKKKFVYLDKYQDKVEDIDSQIEDLNKKISTLDKQLNIAYALIGLLAILLVIF